MKCVSMAAFWAGVALPAAAMRAEGAQAALLEAGNMNLFQARQTVMHPHRLIDRAPAPTPAPEVFPPSDALEKRGSNNNTLGFMPVPNSLAITCPAEWGSTIFPSRGVVGCCQDIASSTPSCIGYTTCLDSSQKTSYTTDNGFTRYCGYSQFQYCYLWRFPNEQYSLWNCDSTPSGTGTLYRTPGPVTVRVTTTTRAGGSSITSTLSSDTAANTNKQPGVGSQGQQPQQPQAQEPLNIGAIVGGAVGGVAILAILIFAITFLFFRNRKPDSGAAPTTADGGGPGVGSPGLVGSPTGHHPEAGVNHQYATYGGYAPVMAQSPHVAGDNRVSTFKPPAGFNTSAHETGATGSPQPHYQHHPQQSPPPQYAGQTFELPIEQDRRPYGLHEAA
ncbi:hypothetical protein RB598_009551 [Gaeumannomyces tritici]